MVNWVSRYLIPTYIPIAPHLQKQFVCSAKKATCIVWLYCKISDCFGKPFALAANVGPVRRDNLN